MLYDKRWEKTEVKADPFSLESLIAWLEKQPAEGVYCYIDSGRCLLSRYFSANGFPSAKITPSYLVQAGRDIPLPPDFDEIAVGPHKHFPVGDAPGWTFGAALDRARAALRQRTS